MNSKQTGFTATSKLLVIRSEFTMLDWQNGSSQTLQISKSKISFLPLPQDDPMQRRTGDLKF